MNNLSNCLSLLAILLLSGCASIVSKSRWPFSVMTEPRGAHVVITNKKGEEVYNGKTPMLIKLKSGAGFFSKESYTVVLTMDGYETRTISVECKLNGWYFGNVLIGGLIGLLIIDPATGAMYKLSSEGITEDLIPLKSSSGSPSLKIIDKATIPADIEKYLVRVK